MIRPSMIAMLANVRLAYLLRRSGSNLTSDEIISACLRRYRETTRQVSSIQSARPTVSPEMNIVFAWNLFCFARFWKVRMDGQHVRKLPAMSLGRPSGSKNLSCIYIGPLTTVTRSNLKSCLDIRTKNKKNAWLNGNKNGRTVSPQ